MATDVLTNKLETTLHITRTVGDDRIKKAKENNEDIAVLSTFLPPSLADAETQAKTAAFVCALGPKCILGDPKKTTPGTKKMEYKTRQWHEPCFACCVCKTPIGTKSFIPREQEIYCATCYEEKFATRCVKCNKIITSGGVTYKNEPWHRECFACTNCSTTLAGVRFTSRDDKPYCAECFGELFSKRCTACSKPITGIGGTRFISFEDRHWHNDCFMCASCKTSLVGRGFITDAEDIICPECAKQKLM
uniref:LIM zinc-binding domain-containing protein n=2 Tax=Proconiini TaxID=565685 RepID=A0A1B6HZH4_9HEMI